MTNAIRFSPRLMLAGSIILVGMLAIQIFPAHAATTFSFTVNTLTDENTNNGNCSLREAVIAANTGVSNYNGCVATGGSGNISAGDTATIELIGGSTYALTLTGTSNTTGDINITNTDITTIITSNNSTKAIIDAAVISNRVIDIAPGVTAELHKITIKNGSPSNQGGGIYNKGSLTIADSLISNNSSGSFNPGGGIYNTGALLIKNTTIQDNFAKKGAGIGTGAVANTTIEESIIQNNNTYAGTLTSGGALYNSGIMMITKSTIEGNTSGQHGGGISQIGDSAVITVTDSTISNNTALAGDGGGLHINGTGNVTIINSTISGNDASTLIGGGVRIAKATLELSNVTIAFNTGFGVSAYESASITSDNTLVIGNIYLDDAPASCGGINATYMSDGYNLENSSFTAGCNFNQNTDTSLSVSDTTSIIDSTLQDNGGLTYTHMLMPGSPAIDAGNTSLSTDQRGVTRLGQTADIGAYEMPNVSIGNANISEGNSGTKNLSFIITIAPAQPNTVSVDYATIAQTATAGTDYTTKTGSLTFAPGETSKTISVSITGDTTVESDETFGITLSNLIGVGGDDLTAVGTITNDDAEAPPTPKGKVTVADANITELDTGNTNLLTFLISMDTAQDANVRVQYSTSALTTIANKDYRAISGTVTFSPDEKTKTVSVIIYGDTEIEGDETFKLYLSGVTGNATITDATAIGTILDNDLPPAPPAEDPADPADPTPEVLTTLPTISITDASAFEGDAGTTQSMSFTVSLSKQHTETVSASYITSAITAGSGSDYTSKSGTISFAPNETSKSISVTILGDNTTESDEIFSIVLSNLVQAESTGNLTATGIILDDDSSVLDDIDETVLDTEPIPDEVLTPDEVIDEVITEETTTDTAGECTLQIGKPYKHPGHPGVWIITQDDFDTSIPCSRRAFINAAIYDSYGFERWSDVITVNEPILNAIPEHTIPFIEWGPEKEYLHGQLIKTPSDPLVYMVLNDIKHGFSSESAFLGVNLDFSSIIDVAKSVLESFPTGSQITTGGTLPNGSLVAYEDSTNIYKLDDFKKQKIQSETAFNTNKFYWGAIMTIPDSLTFEDGLQIN